MHRRDDGLPPPRVRRHGSTATRFAIVWALVWLLGCVDAAITGASVTPAPLTAGVSSIVAVAFTTGIGAPAGGRITVVFPSAFYINEPTLESASSGIADATLAIGSSSNVIVLTIGATAVDPGTAVSFSLSGVTNPGDGTTSSYTIRIADTTGNTIESTSSIAGSSIALQPFADVAVVPSSANAGAPVQLVVSFTTAVLLRVGSILELQFPTLPASTFILSNVRAIIHVGLQAASTVTSTATPFLQVTVAGQDVPANEPVSVTFDRLFNPAAQSLVGLTFSVRTRHVAGSIFQESTGIPIPDIVSTTLSASATVKPSSYLAGVSTTYVVSFPNAAFFGTGAKITVTFPSAFTISGATLAALSNFPTTGTVLSLGTTTATVTLGIGTVLPGSNRGFTLTGVINPGSKCGEYIFEYCAISWPAYTIVITDFAGNIYEQSAAVPGSAILKKPMTFARVRPTIRKPNEVTSAEVSFTSEVTIPIGGSIEVIFPSSFAVDAVVTASGHVGINSASTAVTVNGWTVSLVVAGAIIPPTAKLVVTFTPITTPDSTATGVYIVRTRDAGTNILEEQDKVTGEACPYLNNCNGHGTCTLFSKLCICDPGWGSDSDITEYRTPDCTLRTCPAGKSWNNVPSDATTSHNVVQECSGMGICDRSTGKCTCFSGFTGGACERMTCPNDCKGRGKCVSMRELATLKNALPISVPTTYYGAANYATWDADRVFGCACDSSWAVGKGANEIQVTEYFGGDCSRRHCPSGDDPLTTVDETDCSASGSALNLCHVECSNRGICNYRTGVCKCFTGFSGFACQTADSISPK